MMKTEPSDAHVLLRVHVRVRVRVSEASDALVDADDTVHMHTIRRQTADT